MAESETPNGFRVIQFFLLISVLILVASFVAGRRMVFIGKVIENPYRPLVYAAFIGAYILLIFWLSAGKEYARYLLVLVGAVNFVGDAGTYVRFALTAPQYMPMRVTLVYLLFMAQSVVLLLYAVYTWNNYSSRTFLRHDKTFSVSYCAIWALLLVYMGISLAGGSA